MVRSMFCAGTPSPTESAPCGSRSISRTRRPYSTRAAPRLMVDVVLPTPPFWLHIAMTRAGPCSVKGLGSGRGRCRARAGSSREAAPISGPLSCGRATAEAASARVAMGLLPPPRARSRSFRVRSAGPGRSGDQDATNSDRGSQAGTRGHMSTWRSATTDVTAQAEAAPDIAKTPPRRVSGQRPRVAGRVDLPQPVDGHERVHLCRRHRGVAEQLLHDAYVGSAVEQMGGEGVAQGVRRDLVRQARTLGGRPEDGPGALPRERAAADVQEQRSAAHPGAAVGRQSGPRAHEVLLHGAQGGPPRPPPARRAPPPRPARRPAAPPFSFKATPTTELYALSLHDALPI